jgi:hypothetical protein
MTIAFKCEICKRGGTVEISDNALPLTVRLAKLKRAHDHCLTRRYRPRPNTKQTDYRAPYKD